MSCEVELAALIGSHKEPADTSKFSIAIQELTAPLHPSSYSASNFYLLGSMWRNFTQDFPDRE
jgi:hypothetical protein